MERDRIRTFLGLMKRACLGSMLLLLACAHVETIGPNDASSDAADFVEAADLPDGGPEGDGAVPDPDRDDAVEVEGRPEAADASESLDAADPADVALMPEVSDVGADVDGELFDVVVPSPTDLTALRAAVFAGISTGSKWTLTAASAASGALGVSSGGKWRLRGL